MRKAIAIVLALAVIFAFAACGGKDVKRVGVEETIDLSGRWNDTDSRMVSEAMIGDCINGGWLKKFYRTSAGKAPVVIVGTVRNRSHEHINVQTFTKDLERSLINSGEVEFVASSAERDEIRKEREEQAAFASEDTAKEHGMEVGADYMLKGSINTIEDKEGGKKVMFYQIDLELIHIETNKKVWIGDKKIKKFIKQSRFGL
jgi:uncharacterized protein (TIGR02722 family)